MSLYVEEAYYTDENGAVKGTLYRREYKSAGDGDAGAWMTSTYIVVDGDYKDINELFESKADALKYLDEIAIHEEFPEEPAPEAFVTLVLEEPTEAPPGLHAPKAFLGQPIVKVNPTVVPEPQPIGGKRGRTRKAAG